jgi:hypothetical protein
MNLKTYREVMTLRRNRPPAWKACSRTGDFLVATGNCPRQHASAVPIAFPMVPPSGLMNESAASQRMVLRFSALLLARS